MGAPKTQTIGGGSAAPVADSWNQFLQGQLYQQPGAQSIPQTAAGGMQPQSQSGFGQFAQNAGGMMGMNTAKPGTNQQPGQPGAFQNTFQQMMNPNIANQIANNPFLSGMQGYNPQAQLPGMQNAPNQMPGQPNIPSATGGYTPANAATMDPTGMQGQLGGLGGQDLLKSFGINLNSFLQPQGGGFGPGAQSFTPGQLKDPSTDPSFQAYQDVANRQKMNDIANLRARYGMGANTQSSGASLAEAQYHAEADPRMLAQLGDLGRGIQGLDLQQQEINNRGMAGVNAGLGGAASAGAAANSQNLGNILQFIQGTRGQDVGLAGGLAGQNLSNQQGANNLNASNMLSALGMDQNSMLNLFGQNSNNALNLFGQQSSNALNNQNMGNNWMQGLMGTGMGLQQMGQQGQMQGLQNMFNSYNQAQQIGNPQAQSVQTPSMMSQIAGMGMSLAPLLFPGGGAAMGALGAMGGGGQQRPTMAPPQMNNPFMGQGGFNPNFGIGNQYPLMMPNVRMG